MTKDTKHSIFSDRRKGLDRRQQSLSMPSGLDRRRCSGRRSRHFQAQPWWLRINYAAELISESTVIENADPEQSFKAVLRKKNRDVPPRGKQ